MCEVSDVADNSPVNVVRRTSPPTTTPPSYVIILRGELEARHDPKTKKKVSSHAFQTLVSILTNSRLMKEWRGRYEVKISTRTPPPPRFVFHPLKERRRERRTKERENKGRGELTPIRAEAR